MNSLIRFKNNVKNLRKFQRKEISWESFKKQCGSIHPNKIEATKDESGLGSDRDSRGTFQLFAEQCELSTDWDSFIKLYNELLK